MIKKVDHITFAVKEIAPKRKRLENIFGAKFITEMVDEKEQYRVATFQLGESVISLIESISPKGFISKYIERHGEGVHHIGLEVENLEKTIELLTTEGIEIVPGSDTGGVRKDVLLRARSTWGTALQLVEYEDEVKNLSAAEKLKMCWEN